MPPGRLEYVQPFGIRHLANTHGRPGKREEIARAKEQADEALKHARERAGELRKQRQGS